MDINLRGAFLAARAVVPHMIKRRSGKLVFMASTNSWDAEAGLSLYNVSKAGLYLLAKTLAREFGHGINSNAVGPRLNRTRLTAMLQRSEVCEEVRESDFRRPAGRTRRRGRAGGVGPNDGWLLPAQINVQMTASRGCRK